MPINIMPLKEQQHHHRATIPKVPSQVSFGESAKVATPPRGRTSPSSSSSSELHQPQQPQRSALSSPSSRKARTEATTTTTTKSNTELRIRAFLKLLNELTDNETAVDGAFYACFDRNGHLLPSKSEDAGNKDRHHRHHHHHRKEEEREPMSQLLRKFKHCARSGYRLELVRYQPEQQQHHHLPQQQQKQPTHSSSVLCAIRAVRRQEVLEMLFRMTRRRVGSPSNAGSSSSSSTTTTTTTNTAGNNMISAVQRLGVTKSTTLEQRRQQQQLRRLAELDNINRHDMIGQKDDRSTTTPSSVTQQPYQQQQRDDSNNAVDERLVDAVPRYGGHCPPIRRFAKGTDLSRPTPHAPVKLVLDHHRAHLAGQERISIAAADTPPPSPSEFGVGAGDLERGGNMKASGASSTSSSGKGHFGTASTVVSHFCFARSRADKKQGRARFTLFDDRFGKDQPIAVVVCGSGQPEYGVVYGRYPVVDGRGDCEPGAGMMEDGIAMYPWFRVIADSQATGRDGGAARHKSIEAWNGTEFVPYLVAIEQSSSIVKIVDPSVGGSVCGILERRVVRYGGEHGFGGSGGVNRGGGPSSTENKGRWEVSVAPNASIAMMLCLSLALV